MSLNFKSGSKPTEGGNESFQFRGGDRVTCIVTKILPLKDDEDKLKSLMPIPLPMGKDWQDYSDWKNGCLYVFTVLKVERDGEDIIPLIKIEGDNFVFTHGKFYLNHFHKVSMDSIWGKEGKPKDFQPEGKNGEDKKVWKLSIEGIPLGFDDAIPEERQQYWKKIASLSLNVGEDYPAIKFDGGRYEFDFDSIHELNIGDITSFILSPWFNPQTQKTTFFCTRYAKNKVTDTWVSKKEYDLKYAFNNKDKSRQIAKVLAKLLEYKPKEEAKKQLDKESAEPLAF